MWFSLFRVNHDVYEIVYRNRPTKTHKDIRGGEHILYLYELADTADGWMTFHRTFFYF